MPQITCSTNGCIHNENGACEARTVYVSSIEDGWPRCMDVIWPDDIIEYRKATSDAVNAAKRELP